MAEKKNHVVNNYNEYIVVSSVDPLHAPVSVIMKLDEQE